MSIIPLCAVILTLLTCAVDSFRKMIGGENADITEFPYQVSIEVQGSHNCGGSIIHNQIILTAAHCALHPIGSLQVRAGSSLVETGGIVANVSKKIIHIEFNHALLQNDVALLVLSTPLKYSKTINEVTLQGNRDYVTIGDLATITGWGYLNRQNKKPRNLQKLKLPILDGKKCMHAYKHGKIKVTSKIICAGYLDANISTCVGDSGGPLIVNDKQFGILSFGPIPCEGHLPAAFTRIRKFRDWIRNNAFVYF